MPTFDRKSQKLALFEDLFQRSFKTHNQLTEENKRDSFHSLLRGDALQTFKNVSRPNRENLLEILTVFRRKYVKPHSMATAKHNFQRVVFNPANQKLKDLSDELQKLAEDALGVFAHAIIEQFIYAKIPPHLMKLINRSHLEIGMLEQIVTLLERELELNSLEAPGETQMNTVTPKQQFERNKDNAGKINSTTNDSNPNSNRNDGKSGTVYTPCLTCGKTNYPTDRCYVGVNASIRPFPWKSKPGGQIGHQKQDAQYLINNCA